MLLAGIQSCFSKLVKIIFLEIKLSYHSFTIRCKYLILYIYVPAEYRSPHLICTEFKIHKAGDSAGTKNYYTRLCNGRKSSCNFHTRLCSSQESLFNFYARLCNGQESLCNGQESLCNGQKNLCNGQKSLCNFQARL